MENLIAYFSNHWVEIGIALWGLEKFLEVISTLTPWKWDDNLGIILAKVLQSVFPKKGI